MSVPTDDGVGAWCTAGERNPVCTQVAMRAYREQSLAMGPARLGVVVGGDSRGAAASAERNGRQL